MQNHTTAKNFVEGAIFTYFNSHQKWSKPMVIIGIDEKNESFSAIPLEQLIPASRLSEIFDKGNKPLKFEYTPDKRNVVLSDKGFIIQSTSDIRNFDAVGHNAKKKNNFVSIEDFKREGKDVNSTDTSDSNESNFDRFVRLNSFSSYQFQGHIQFLMFIVEVSDRFKHQMPLFFTQEENPEWDRYEQQYRDSQKENTIE